MSAPISPLARVIDAVRARLRPCTILPRPIPSPLQNQIRQIAGER
jgi:hypothetical protein